MADLVRPEAGELAQALSVFARWLGEVPGERASLWVERLRMNEEELARFRDAPYVGGPSHAPQRVAPEAPAPADGPARRMSGPDAATALRRAHESSSSCFFTQIAGEPAPPADGYLNGAPFAVKDLIGVAGMQRTGGSASEARTPFPHDAAAVASLRRHGGVVIGLANLHELAFGATSANPVFGAVVNPAAPQCIPGGSSGGSAALVAAGVAPVALATDTGGSIRIPAACCGVVGFKPGYDVVSRDGVLEVAQSLDHVGPIGRTVADCAYAFAALTDLPAFGGLRERPLAGIRVGRLAGHFEQPLETHVRQALDDACGRMQRDGAELTSMAVEGAELAAAIYFVTVLTEAGCEHAERHRQHAARLGEDVRVRLEIASFVPGHWYLKAQRLRRQLAERLQSRLAEADVLLCATLRTPAPKIGALAIDIDGQRYPLHAAVSDLTLLFNLTGVPAISIPWGTSPDGAPIGIQVIGQRGQDWKVLEVAARLEALRNSAS